MASTPTVTQKLFEQLSAEPTTKAPTKQLGKEDFVKLLTLQLRMQNPLNPSSNQEMAAQLAQFSALEQLQNISASLDQLLQSNASLALSVAQYSAPALIGRTATVNASTFSFDGTNPIELGYELPSAAAEVTIEVRSAGGAVIRTIEVPSSALAGGKHTITWDGLDSRGNRAPAGTYSFVVRATSSDGSDLSVIPFLRGTISGIRYSTEGLMVVIGGVEVSISSIVELR